MSTGASMFMFNAYLKVRRPVNLYLVLTFFWIGLHAFAFALPTIINPGDLKLLAFGYIVGIGMIFLALLSIIEILAYISEKRISRSRINFMCFIGTISAVSVLAIMIYDFRLPIINPQGIIFWNNNPIAAWLISIVVSGYAYIFGYLFYRSALIMEKGYLKARMLVMAADGFILGTVVILVHTSSNAMQTIIGHTLFLITGIITLAIYLLPNRFFAERIS